MRPFCLVLTLCLSLLPLTAAAQWINYRAPGTPRLPDGRPNLAAPAPRTADGKPDLSGAWRGAGPIYRFNIAQDLKPEDIQPWAEALFLQRVRDSRKFAVCAGPAGQCHAPDCSWRSRRAARCPKGWFGPGAEIGDDVY